MGTGQLSSHIYSYSSASNPWLASQQARRHTGYGDRTVRLTVGSETVTVLARLGPRRSRCVPSARPPSLFIRVSQSRLSPGPAAPLLTTLQLAARPGSQPNAAAAPPRIPTPEPKELPQSHVTISLRDHCSAPKREHNPASQWQYLAVHHCSQSRLLCARLRSWLMELVFPEDRYQGLAKPSQQFAGYGNDIY